MPTTVTADFTWIRDICRRASDALGWNLDFQSAGEEDWSGAAATWQADVHDGADLVGRLRLTPHPAETDEADLRTAIAAADVVGDLVNRLAAAQRKLDSRSRDVQTLMDLGRTLPRDSSLSGALDRLLRAAVQLTGYWASAFFLVDGQRAQVRLRATHGLERHQIPRPERPLAQASPDRSALLQNMALLDGGDHSAASWLPACCSVGFCVPVHTAEGPLGTLWCYDRRHRTITDRDIHVLQSVAAQITSVLERTVLLKESAARQRMRDELLAVSERHTTSAVCPIPLDWGLEIAAKSVNAAELGGDLCEVWPTGPQRTLIAVGDALGHSIPAAMIMAIARGSLRTLLQEESDRVTRTDVLMRRLNQTLCTVTKSEQFMTMVCAVIDLKSMTMTYTNAGHPPPWLSRDGRRTPLQSHGLLLGVMPDAGYSHTMLPLRRGDLLVFFTDGISEAMSRDRSVFRTEGVLSALGDNPEQSASEAAEAIWSRLRWHLGEQEPMDDQTLLVVKVRG